jgi:hypothetical protein
LKKLAGKRNSKLLALLEESWIGEIVDVDSDPAPENVGRCKVWLYGLTDGLDKDVLPWAYPKVGLVENSFSTPKKGRRVFVEFDKDFYSQYYTDSEDVSDALKDDIKTGGYHGFHSLVADYGEKLKVMYTRNSGMIIEVDGKVINIARNKNSIKLSNQESKSSIELIGGIIQLKCGVSEAAMFDDGLIVLKTDVAMITMSAEGINIDAGGENVFVNGKYNVLYSKVPDAEEILDVTEIGVSKTVTVGK